MFALDDSSDVAAAPPAPASLPPLDFGPATDPLPAVAQASGGGDGATVSDLFGHYADGGSGEMIAARPQVAGGSGGVDEVQVNALANITERQLLQARPMFDTDAFQSLPKGQREAIMKMYNDGVDKIAYARLAPNDRTFMDAVNGGRNPWGKKVSD